MYYKKKKKEKLFTKTRETKSFEQNLKIMSMRFRLKNGEN